MIADLSMRSVLSVEASLDFIAAVMSVWMRDRMLSSAIDRLLPVAYKGGEHSSGSARGRMSAVIPSRLAAGHTRRSGHPLPQRRSWSGLHGGPRHEPLPSCSLGMHRV